MTTSPTGKMPGNPENGFTLIELMFVVGLFLMMAGFSLPVFRRSFGAWTQEVAARDVLDAMNVARGRAVMERVEYGVRIASGDNRFWLVRRQSGVDGAEFERVPGSRGTVRRLPGDAQFQGGSLIVFYPNGTATPASLQVRTRDHRVILSVDPVTGRGLLHAES